MSIISNASPLNILIVVRLCSPRPELRRMGRM